MVWSFGFGYYPGTGTAAGAPYADSDILEPTDFNYRNVGFANFAETMVPGIGPIGEALESGFRVKAQDLPSKVRYDDARQVLDFDTMSVVDFVSPRAKALIERFEPDVHQFEPVEYVRSDGTHVADMFVFVVCRRLDTMDRAHTNMLLSPHRWVWAKDLARRKPELVPPGTDLEAKPRFVFNLGQIGDAHIWRDIHIHPTVYSSDAIVEAIKAEGLTGFGGAPQETVA
jgi:hypothetical protein